MVYNFENELKMGIAIKNGKFPYSDALNTILEIVTGNLLGDATIISEAKLKPPTGFSVQLVSSKREYIDHLYNVYSPWTTAKIYDKNIKRKSIVTNQPLNPCWAFITRVQKVLLPYQDWNGTTTSGPKKKTKVLPSNIEELLTPRAIAYWFMDDGAINEKGSKGFMICTDGFEKSYVETLINILTNKYGVICKLSKIISKKGVTQYRIRIQVAGHDTFRDIVEPYMLPCFEYKINPV